MGEVIDNEVKALALISGAIEGQYVVDGQDPWDGSPFKWIKGLSSRAIGAVGEKLVAGWAEAKGFEVTRTGDSEADRIIAGHRIEIKFSTLWANGGFKFQQIRDQDYDYCFCLGVSPFDAHAWLIPKEVLRKHVIGHMGQHTGAEGSDTAWLGFQVGEEYEWMKPYGGRLDDVKRLLDQAGQGSRTQKDKS